MFLDYPILLIFPAAMAFAGAMDLLTLTIPNRISLVLIAGFLIAVPFTGMSLESFLLHVGAGTIVLLFGMVMFAFGWVGGGDAKLMASAALWIGFDNLLNYLADVTILGGVLAIVILVYRRFPVASLPIPSWAARLHKPGSGIPYGLAIAGGGLLIYPDTVWFTVLGT